LISLAAAATGVASFVAPSDREVMQVDGPQILPVAARQVSAPWLPPRESIGQARGDPFTQRSWAPAPAAPLVSEAPQAPSAPSNPYRFAGTAHYRGSLKAIFVLADRVYAAPAGEVLEGGYRVQWVSPQAATLLYLPLGIEQHMEAMR